MTFPVGVLKYNPEKKNEFWSVLHLIMFLHVEDYLTLNTL